MTEILVGAGANSIINSLIYAIIDPSKMEEVIVFDKKHAIEFEVPEHSPISILYSSRLNEECDEDKYIASENICIVLTFDSLNTELRDTLRVLTLCKKNIELVNCDTTMGIVKNVLSVKKITREIYIKPSKYSQRRYKTICGEIDYAVY